MINFLLFYVLFFSSNVVILAHRQELMAFFETVADEHTKDIVNGYLRLEQDLLPHTENSYYTIPALVIHLILSFFYNPEYFTIHGSRTKLNEDYDTFKFTKDQGNYGLNTTYGNIEIHKEMYCNNFIWKFEIISIKTPICVAIGIDSSNKQYSESSFDSIMNDHTFYSYESIQSHSQMRGNSGVKFDYGSIYCTAKTTISMELDMKQKTLRYFVNGEDQGIAINDVNFANDERYSVAISTDNDIKIKLLQFEQSRE